jgi:DUF1009 family protein
LPFVVARCARAQGVSRLIAVGFEGETDPALAQEVNELVWVKVGQLGKLIQAFAKRGITQCVMAGQVNPKNLWDLRPDLRALTLLLRIKERNARTLFGAIVNELAKESITVLDARPWLQSITPSSGYRMGPKLSRAQADDVAFGYRIAKAVSDLEIGQLVVVKNGTVLAVEGFEGTDACLRRGGALAGKAGGAVAVKVASEQHDYRFDIPCVGPQTVHVCGEVAISTLAFESGKTLLLDREELEEQAVSSKISLVALP